MTEVVAVDLFCGIGGLTHGLERAGIPVVAGIDADSDCRYAYEANNRASFEQADVDALSSDDVAALFREPQKRQTSTQSNVDEVCRILAGCAPCQPFSCMAHGSNTSDREDWRLLSAFGRLVRDILPEIVVMENVLQLRNHHIYSRFVDTLFKHGYDLVVDKVVCPDYGVPQDRRRLVLFASRLGPIDFVDPTHSVEERPTVRDAIGDGVVPPIAAGEAHDEDRLHRARTLSDVNLDRVRQSKPGGTWYDWEETLRLDCHRKESGRSYQSVYGRMEWNAPSPTVTTQFYNYGSGRFGHPEQDRALSLREGAILQTFPRDYEFVADDEEVSFKEVGRFVGNAVPVRLATAIGQSITEHLERHDVITTRDGRAGEKDGERDEGVGGNGTVSDVPQSQRVESLGSEPIQ